MDKILSILNNTNFINFVIYKEKIVLASNSVLNALGYSHEEIIHKSIEDLVPENLKHRIKSIKERRLKGESFFNKYIEIPAIAKNGIILNYYVFSDTIEYRGKPAGFLLLIDISERNFIENVINLINHLNSISFSIENEESFISSVCKKIYNNLEKCVSVTTKYNIEKNIFDIICGKEKISKNEIKHIDNIFRENLEQIKNNQILFKKINSSNFKLIFAIPIKNRELKYVIFIFSYIPNLEETIVINLLKNIQNTIINIFEKLTKETNYKILYKALENSPDWVLITDRNSKIIYVNRTVERLTKYSKDELIGNYPSILKSGYYDKDFYQKMWDTLLSGKPFSCVILNKNKFGKPFKIEHLIIPIKTGKEITHFVSLGKDLSREEKLQGKIFELKFKDILTNVYNRFGFIITVENIFSSVKKESKDTNYALILIDLCNFSHINSVYNEEIGDEILKDIAKTLSNTELDTIIGRLGGDEFALFKKIDKDNIENYIKNLIELFKISKFSSLELNISVNIGISVYPDDSKNLRVLINYARTSLELAQSRGENEFEFYNQEIRHSINKRIQEKELIEEAIDNNWFKIFLQPYFYTANLNLAGFEALLRIEHPERGILTPYYFINTLEESNYLFEVEKFLIDTVVNTLNRWDRDDISISINLTGRSLKNSSIISFFESKISTLKTDAIINVEVTERILLENLNYLQKLFNRWRKLNVYTSLDDFGTGYSSLSYISELPINIIKIDISFVKKMMENRKTLAITETIILMAKKLGLKTIAEGVETEEQLNHLKDFQCDIVQGFLLGKPCPINDAEKFLLSMKSK